MECMIYEDEDGYSVNVALMYDIYVRDRDAEITWDEFVTYVDAVLERTQFKGAKTVYADEIVFSTECDAYRFVDIIFSEDD